MSSVSRRVPLRWVAAGMLAVALVLAGIVSYYASRSPDGLNRVAQDNGFSNTQKAHGTNESPLAGYSSSGVDNQRLSGGLAGVVGVLVVLTLAGGLTYVIRRRPRPRVEDPGPEPGDRQTVA
ncbi:PDGLE domain-containing protein [Nocardioides sp.]|uniref:PDGLE domain-containing protein n=1 Tax=Nocardioides sp. TaxID=35761 RepID=UPI0031FEB84F|nr:cobalt transport protein CbiN [Nocardioides sp.]